MELVNRSLTIRLYMRKNLFPFSVDVILLVEHESISSIAFLPQLSV